MYIRRVVRFELFFFYFKTLIFCVAVSRLIYKITLNRSNHHFAKMQSTFWRNFIVFSMIYLWSVILFFFKVERRLRRFSSEISELSIKNKFVRAALRIASGLSKFSQSPQTGSQLWGGTGWQRHPSDFFCHPQDFTEFLLSRFY